MSLSVCSLCEMVLEMTVDIVHIRTPSTSEVEMQPVKATVNNLYSNGCYVLAWSC